MVPPHVFLFQPFSAIQGGIKGVDLAEMGVAKSALDDPAHGSPVGSLPLLTCVKGRRIVGAVSPTCIAVGSRGISPLALPPNQRDTPYGRRMGEYDKISLPSD